MTRRRAACCCDVTPPTLSCPQINLLCHGPGPATISISGESTYSATYSYLEGTETGDVWYPYTIWSGVCQFELTGPYTSGGVNNTGINHLTGTLTSTISVYYPTTDTMFVYYYAVAVSTADFYTSASYACGSFTALLGGTYGATQNGIPFGNGNATWRIGGVICDQCLNPTIVCAPLMVSAFGDPASVGTLFVVGVTPVTFNFYGTYNELMELSLSEKLGISSTGYYNFSVT